MCVWVCVCVWWDETTELEKTLGKDKWEAVERPPDGHCLYHCFVGAGLEEAIIMRVRVATWL